MCHKFCTMSADMARIVNTRKCSIFLHSNAKLAFLFLHVPRPRVPVQNLRFCVHAFLKCQERGNAKPGMHAIAHLCCIHNLTIYVQYCIL